MNNILPSFFGGIMKKYIYALDLSLNNTGIAIFTNNGTFVECSSISTTDEKDIRGKFVIIANEYKKFMRAYPVDKVVMEQGFTRYNISTQMIFRCVGLTNYIFSEYEQISIPASTVKKIITGKGNATKEEVKDSVLKIYPKIRFQNLDESDAVSVGIAYFRKEGVHYA